MPTPETTEGDRTRVREGLRMTQVREFASAVPTTARGAEHPAAVAAARTAGQAAGVPHVPTHAPHVAAYAHTAVVAEGDADSADAERGSGPVSRPFAADGLFRSVERPCPGRTAALSYPRPRRLSGSADTLTPRGTTADRLALAQVRTGTGLVQGTRRQAVGPGQSLLGVAPGQPGGQETGDERVTGAHGTR